MTRLHLGSRHHSLAAPDTTTAADWRERSACLDVTPELFFPDEDLPKSLQRQMEGEAKAICRGCPVLEQCRAWGESSPVRLHGVWGGTSDHDRRAPMVLASSKRASAVRREGRGLAVEHGTDLIGYRRRGLTDAEIAARYGTTVEAARRALRILLPAGGLAMRTLTPLERLLAVRETELRAMSAAGCGDHEIAKEFGAVDGTVNDALRILAHRDAAAAQNLELAA